MSRCEPNRESRIWSPLQLAQLSHSQPVAHDWERNGCCFNPLSLGTINYDAVLPQQWYIDRDGSKVKPPYALGFKSSNKESTNSPISQHQVCRMNLRGCCWPNLSHVPISNRITVIRKECNSFTGQAWVTLPGGKGALLCLCLSAFVFAQTVLPPWSTVCVPPRPKYMAGT